MQQQQFFGDDYSYRYYRLSKFSEVITVSATIRINTNWNNARHTWELLTWELNDCCANHSAPKMIDGFCRNWARLNSVFCQIKLETQIFEFFYGFIKLIIVDDEKSENYFRFFHLSGKPQLCFAAVRSYSSFGGKKRESIILMTNEDPRPRHKLQITSRR